MHEEIIRQQLLRKPLKCDCEGTLYELRGNQYKSKEEIVEDILENNDGSVDEQVELERSPLGILRGKPC